MFYLPQKKEGNWEYGVVGYIGGVGYFANCFLNGTISQAPMFQQKYYVSLSLRLLSDRYAFKISRKDVLNLDFAFLGLFAGFPGMLAPSLIGDP